MRTALRRPLGETRARGPRLCAPYNLWRAYRIRHVDMPATPERLWAAIREGRRLHTL